MIKSCGRVLILIERARDVIGVLAGKRRIQGRDAHSISAWQDTHRPATSGTCAAGTWPAVSGVPAK